eukprot:1134789-Amphidinium_carterae.1
MIVRVWYRGLFAGKLEWPLSNALCARMPFAMGRGPLIRNLRQLAEKLGWVPDEHCWRAQGQWFSWEETGLKAKCDFARVLCARRS